MGHARRREAGSSPGEKSRGKRGATVTAATEAVVAPGVDPAVRERIAEQVLRLGASAVARRMGVPRSTILSYLAGSARRGNRVLIEQQAAALDAPEGPRAA